MKFTCIDNTEMDGILTKGKEYAGEMAYHRDFIKIFRCDDKKPGFFEPYRFEEVISDVDPVYEVKIFTYCIESKET